MNLCIDRGNSSTKIGIFQDNLLISNKVIFNFGVEELTEIFSEYNVDATILSEVVSSDNEVKDFIKNNSGFFIELNHITPLPFINNYDSPDTLGKDRLAAVAGATYLKPETDLLVIDAGTAITYDFIDAGGIYHGGNIAPGIELRNKALNLFTERLPLIDIKTDTPLIGKDTISAINSGIIYGVVFEIDGYIDTLRNKYPCLSTFLTGGSIFYFDKKLKNSIFAEKFLVLFGLNRILQYNVKF